jgi:hypothetical protein
MASIVQQTLYAASGGTPVLTDVSNPDYVTNSPQTLAQTHDASDATYSLFGISGDGVGSGSMTVTREFTMDSCTYAGVIDKVRVRCRYNFGGGETKILTAMHNGSTVGAQAGSESVGWQEWDFATKPEGGAWTAATVNRTWGWQAQMVTPDESSSALFYKYEFEVLVYGPEDMGGPISAEGVGVAGLVASASASSEVSASGAGSAEAVASSSGDAVVSASGVSGSGSVSGSVHFNPPLSVDLTDVNLIDGVTGVILPPAQGFSKTGQRNLRSLGKPHFAFTNLQEFATSPFSGGEYGIGGTFMLTRLPDEQTAPEEVHWLFSYHDPAVGGSELLSIGITPSGRFAFSSGGNGTVFSAYGAVPVDGLFHNIRFDLYSSGGGQRQAFLDGVGILDVVGPNNIDYPQPGGYSASAFGSRLSIFNGRDGLSVLDCSVAAFEVSAEEGSISWKVDEGSGPTITSYTDPSWLIPDPPVALEATWFNGVPLGACPEFPTLPLNAAYIWGHGTAWTPRPPYRPEYTKVVSP